MPSHILLFPLDNIAAMLPARYDVALLVPVSESYYVRFSDFLLSRSSTTIHPAHYFLWIHNNIIIIITVNDVVQTIMMCFLGFLRAKDVLGWSTYVVLIIPIVAI